MSPLLPGPETPGRVPARSEPYVHRPPPEMYEDEVDLRDVWGVLRRRRWTIAAVLGAMLALVGAWTWLQVPVWRAQSLIRIDEPNRSDVPVLDVLASLQQGSEIETEMRILRTRPIMEAVTDELDLQLVVLKPAEVPRELLFERIEFGRATPEIEYRLAPAGGAWRLTSVGERTGEVSREVRPGEPVEIPGGTLVLADLAPLGGEEGFGVPAEIRFTTLGFQDAVQRLSEALEVTRPDREANVLQVAYEGTDRPLVTRVPNAVAANFIEQRQQVQKTEIRSTVEFLQEQSEALKAQLEAAEAELQSFREGRQIVALGTEAEAQVERLAELQTQRTQLDAERSALANLMGEIDAGAGRPDYRRLAAFPTFLRNEAIADILQQLTAAGRARTDLLTRRTESHPDVVALTLQIEQLEDQLGDIGRNYLRSLNDQIASLDAVLARFGSELEEIPEKEVQFARLERQTSLLAELYTLLQTRLKEAQIAEAVEDPAVRVVESAILPREPVSPRPARNLALAGILGIMLGVGLAFVREYMDTRIHSTENVEALLGLPAIGRIPNLALGNGKGDRREALITESAGKSVGAEAFRTLRTNVRFVRGGAGATEMVVTSPGPKEGKSVTAANLAAALAQQGIRTLLVDADLRRSVQHQQFGVEREPGLSTVLTGMADLSDALVGTHIEGLDLLPGGASPPNPAELLGGPRMDALLQTLRERYESIVLDSPPMLAVTDAAVLGPKVQGVILVVRAEQTEREAAGLALSQLRHVGATVLGVVMNDASAGGSYYYYRRYYGEEKEKKGLRRLLPG